MKLFHQFCSFYFQFSFQKLKRIINRLAQNSTYCQKMRFLIIYHTTIRRYADLTIRKSIKCIYSLIGRNTRSKCYTNLHLIGSQVLYFSYLNFTLFSGLNYRFAKSHNIFAIWNLVDYYSLIICLFCNFSSYSNRTAALSVIIS